MRGSGSDDNLSQDQIQIVGKDVGERQTQLPPPPCIRLSAVKENVNTSMGLGPMIASVVAPSESNPILKYV